MYIARNQLTHVMYKSSWGVIGVSLMLDSAQVKQDPEQSFAISFFTFLLYISF